MGTFGQIMMAKPRRPRLLHREPITPRPRMLSLVVSPLRPRTVRVMTTDRTGMGNPAGLTNNELAVLVWCANGKRLSDIGVIMGVSDDVARAISLRIRLKVGAQTIAGAVAIALRRGIIQ